MDCCRVIMSDLFTDRLLATKRAVEALEWQIDQNGMTGKIGTDNLVRLLGELELAHQVDLKKIPYKLRAISSAIQRELREVQVATTRLEQSMALWSKHGLHCPEVSPTVKKLTPQEKAKGRSSNYWQMSAEDQWAEDKRLGILDWDGS